MKLYSNKITEGGLDSAFHQARSVNGADIYPVDVRTFRPRRDGFTSGIQFYAESYSGNRATGHREIGSYPLDDVPRAASWDAYGYVIARLFLVDPDAVIGQYSGVEDFKRQVRQYAPYRRPRSDAPFLSLLDK